MPSQRRARSSSRSSSSGSGSSSSSGSARSSSPSSSSSGGAASPPPPRQRLSPPGKAGAGHSGRSRSREPAKRQRRDASPRRRPERRGGNAALGEEKPRRNTVQPSGKRVRSRSPVRRLPPPPDRAGASPPGGREGAWRASRVDQEAGGVGEPGSGEEGLGALPPPPALPHPPAQPRKLPHEQAQTHSGGRGRSWGDGGGRGGRGEGGRGRGAGRGRGDEEAPASPVEPNFKLSGKLAEETNTVRGVVLVHTEPPEARKPTLKWRLYIFKGGTLFGDPLYIHRQSSYLFGREHRVVDVPTDHPSCSKQHAVLQYRLIENDEGTAVRPYLMDLGSTNGTFLNDERLEPQRYYELLEKDMVKFGNSSREYVLIHEKSA